MPSPGQSPFDGNPLQSPPVLVGYRPSKADFNDAALINDDTAPPDPQTMPTAELLNTDSWLLISLARMTAAGAFVITAQVSPIVSKWAVAANLVQSNPFTVVRNGAGDYSITWPANLLPLILAPQASITTLSGANSVGISAVYITNGVQVQTTKGGTLTDMNFMVSLF